MVGPLAVVPYLVLDQLRLIVTLRYVDEEWLFQSSNGIVIRSLGSHGVEQLYGLIYHDILFGMFHSLTYPNPG